MEAALAAALPALAASGPWAMLAGVAWFVLTGRLITAKAHDDRVADKDAIIATQQATIDTVLRQQADLLAGARLGAKALEAIRQQAEAGDGGGMAA